MKVKGEKVAVGMSGGVDSSVSAYLLKVQGYEVEGVYIEAWNEPGCRTDEDRKDALRVATKLGIPFRVVDMKSDYKKRVVEYFYREYERGRTPNPDVVCNKEIKFGLFYEWARQQGYRKIATGHYARVNERGLLQRAVDKKKDQSYFLWQVEPKILANVLFPLGEKKKGEVRKVASRLDLHVKDKPDSMGVCFIGEVDVKELLREKLGEKKGEVIYQGEVVGEHDGVWFFTVGQRGGFELDKKRLNKIGVDASSMGALYVLEKDAKRNRVIVGEKSEVYRDVIELGGYNTYIDKNEVVQLAGSGKVFIRVRNLGELVEIKDIKVKDEGMRVILGSKIFGVAEGQSGVLYAGEDGDEEVVGGGIIE